MFPRQTIQLTSDGRPVRLHLISTGMGADKTRMREPRFNGLLSTIDILFDRQFTEWLPVWVMVIEHPEGIFVIDTGECAAAATPGYFRPAGWLANRYMTTQFRFSITREEEIDHQLNALGIAIADIRAVILTHLHFDHTDGLKHFPATPIFLHRLEWEHPFGAMPHLYPRWFQPTLLDLDQSLGPFKKAYFLTPGRDLALVHTPGHTFGHCSVLLRADDHHILFAADTCYDQDQLIHDAYPARPASRRLTRDTYAAIRTYARDHPLIFLPSHDAASALRLNGLQTLPSADILPPGHTLLPGDNLPLT